MPFNHFHFNCGGFFYPEEEEGGGPWDGGRGGGWGVLRVVLETGMTIIVLRDRNRTIEVAAREWNQLLAVFAFPNLETWQLKALAACFDITGSFPPREIGGRVDVVCPLSAMFPCGQNMRSPGDGVVVAGFVGLMTSVGFGIEGSYSITLFSSKHR